jgi:hypothetical protein
MALKEARKPRGKEDAANDRPEADDDADEIIAASKIDADRIIGSAGDMLLEELKQSRDWQKLTQAEQERLIKRYGYAAREIVAGVVVGVADKGLPSMAGTMEDSGSFKDGFFLVKVAVPMTPHNSLMLSRRAGEVQIVFATVKEFESGMLAEPEPDQKSLLPPDAANERDGQDVEGESFTGAEADDAGDAQETEPPNRRRRGAAASAPPGV